MKICKVIHVCDDENGCGHEETLSKGQIIFDRPECSECEQNMSSLFFNENGEQFNPSEDDFERWHNQ